MKTIDELLDEVSRNLNAAAPKNIPQSAKKATSEKAPDKQTLSENPEKPAEPTAKKCGCGKGECEKGKCSCHSKGFGLDMAKELAYAAELAAEKFGVDVSVAVCNADGKLMLFNTMDNAILASVGAAQDKAYTAAALRMPTHTALKESRGGKFDGLPNGNGILLLGGGYPLEADGKFFGGIGVSGGSCEQDMLIALIAAEYFKIRIKTVL